MSTTIGPKPEPGPVPVRAGRQPVAFPPEVVPLGSTPNPLTRLAANTADVLEPLPEDLPAVDSTNRTVSLDGMRGTPLRTAGAAIENPIALILAQIRGIESVEVREASHVPELFALRRRVDAVESMLRAPGLSAPTRDALEKSAARPLRSTHEMISREIQHIAARLDASSGQGLDEKMSRPLDALSETSPFEPNSIARYQLNDAVAFFRPDKQWTKAICVHLEPGAMVVAYRHANGDLDLSVLDESLLASSNPLKLGEYFATSLNSGPAWVTAEYVASDGGLGGRIVDAGEAGYGYVDTSQITGFKLLPAAEPSAPSANAKAIIAGDNTVVIGGEELFAPVQISTQIGHAAAITDRGFNYPKKQNEDTLVLVANGDQIAGAAFDHAGSLGNLTPSILEAQDLKAQLGLTSVVGGASSLGALGFKMLAEKIAQSPGEDPVQLAVTAMKWVHQTLATISERAGLEKPLAATCAGAILLSPEWALVITVGDATARLYSADGQRDREFGRNNQYEHIARRTAEELYRTWGDRREPRTADEEQRLSNALGSGLVFASATQASLGAKGSLEHYTGHPLVPPEATPGLNRLIVELVPVKTGDVLVMASDALASTRMGEFKHDAYYAKIHRELPADRAAQDVRDILTFCPDPVDAVNALVEYVHLSQLPRAVPEGTMTPGDPDNDAIVVMKVGPKLA